MLITLFGSPSPNLVVLLNVTKLWGVGLVKVSYNGFERFKTGGFEGLDLNCCWKVWNSCLGLKSCYFNSLWVFGFSSVLMLIKKRVTRIVKQFQLLLQLLASYIGEFQTHRQFPTLTEKYLLIPYVSAKIDPKTHPQVLVRKSGCFTISVTYNNWAISPALIGRELNVR